MYMHRASPIRTATCLDTAGSDRVLENVTRQVRTLRDAHISKIWPSSSGLGSETRVEVELCEGYIAITVAIRGGSERIDRDKKVPDRLIRRRPRFRSHLPVASPIPKLFESPGPPGSACLSRAPYHLSSVISAWTTLSS